MEYQPWSTASIPSDHFPAPAKFQAATADTKQVACNGNGQQINGQPVFNFSVREQMLSQLYLTENNSSVIHKDTQEWTGDVNYSPDLQNLNWKDGASSFERQSPQFLPLKMQMLLQLQQLNENESFSRKTFSRECLHLDMKELFVPLQPLRYPKWETLEELKKARRERLKQKSRKEGPEFQKPRSIASPTNEVKTEMDRSQECHNGTPVSEGHNPSPPVSSPKSFPKAACPLAKPHDSPCKSCSRSSYEVPPRFRKQDTNRVSPQQKNQTSSKNQPCKQEDFASWRQAKLASSSTTCTKSSSQIPQPVNDTSLEEEVDIDALLLGPADKPRIQGARSCSPSELMLESSPAETNQPAAIVPNTASLSHSTPAASPVSAGASPLLNAAASPSPATQPLIASTYPVALNAAQLIEKQQLQQLQRQQIMVMLIEQNRKAFKNVEVMKLLSFLTQQPNNLAKPFVVPELLNMLMAKVCAQINLTPVESIAAKRFAEIAQIERQLFHPALSQTAVRANSTHLPTKHNIR